jgi:hypothetical protein
VAKRDAGNNTRDIRNFFKPFTVPKNRVPANDNVEDEIIIAPPQQRARQQDAAHGILGRKAAPPRSSQTSSSSRTLSPESPLSSTPTRRKSAEKSTAMSSLDGTADDEDGLLHRSPSASRQRRLASVDVPSPSRRASPTLPAPKTASTAAPAQAPTTSFSSLSTLPSLPHSSQSSRRVIRNGIHAVTNSDSGSDSDDLADPDSFVPRKRIKMTPPGSNAARAIETASTVKAGSKRHSGRVSDKSSMKISNSTPLSPPRTAYKFSLERMVRETQKRKKEDARIAEAEAAVALAAKKREEDAAKTEALQSMDAKALATMMAEEGDDQQRMVLAVARTEALMQEETFCYFEDNSAKVKRAPFPISKLPDTSWAPMLKDDAAREQACLSGFVADLAACGKLSPEMTTWFARQLVREQREDLCEAYIYIIYRAIQHSNQLDVAKLADLETFYHTTVKTKEPSPAPHAAQTPESSQLSEPPDDDVMACICEDAHEEGGTVCCDQCDTWQHILCYYPQYEGRDLPDDFEHQCVSCRPRTIDINGARKRQAKLLARRSPPPESTEKKAQIPGLRYVAKLTQLCAPLAGVDGVGRAFCHLALASIDDNVRKDMSLRLAFSNAIEAVMDQVEPGDKEKVYHHARETLLTGGQLSTKLQCRLIASLPATTTQTHELRRRLALYLVTKSQKNRSLTSEEWLSVLLKRLRTAPEFIMGQKTDYSELMGMVSMLDIAIDAGFSDFAFLHTQPEERSKPSGRFSAKAPTPPAEQAFNRQVDSLAAQLRTMFNSIMGAGASHVSRVEAKNALDRLILRIEHSVRTMPKPRKGIFDSVSSHSRNFMEGFVKIEEPSAVGGAEQQATVNGETETMGPSSQLALRSSPNKRANGTLEAVEGGAAGSLLEESKSTSVVPEDERDEAEVVPPEMLSDREMSEDSEGTLSDAQSSITKSNVAETKHATTSSTIGGMDGAMDASHEDVATENAGVSAEPDLRFTLPGMGLES